MRHWAAIDGKLAAAGAPSILDMSARRGLNLAYWTAIEFKDSDELAEFESMLGKSMLELQLERELRKVHEKEDRKRLAADFGEVG